MSVDDLWLAYFALGGNQSVATVDDWMAARAAPSGRDLEIMAVVANEALADLGLAPVVPYNAAGPA